MPPSSGAGGSARGTAALQKARRQKLILSLTEDAANAVRDVAEAEGITISEAVRRAIAVHKFVSEQLHDGATFLLTKDDGKTVEKVHFVFS